MSDTLFPLPEEKQKNTTILKGKPRLETWTRQQKEMRVASLDELLPEDHRARLVWEIVQGYNMEEFYTEIGAIEGEAGRPAIDPRLLTAVWLYASLEGVGSARALARLCEEHIAYQWLMGGIRANYHTLADFRVQQESKLDRLLTQGVAALMREGLVDMERTAQDGVRIRASAGTGSFRKQETLADCLRKAEKRVAELKGEGKSEENTSLSKGQQASRERHARERVERVKQAMKEAAKVEAKKEKNRELKRKNRPARASTTDPEARVMKMGDGGFRPAYNGQLNIDMDSRIIVGVDMCNEGDSHELEPMLQQTQERYGELMNEHYMDGGYRSNKNITYAGQRDVTVYSPIPESYNILSKKKPEDILPNDSPEVIEWKQRMSTEEAKEKYKERASTIEWANALLRNRGLYRFLVRGIRKARAVLLWFALAHNLMQMLTLRSMAQSNAVG